VRLIPAQPISVRDHLILLVMAAVLPVVVFGGWLALSISDERRSAVERELHDTARGLAASVDRELSNTVATLKILATSRNLERRDFSLFYADARRRLETQRSWMAVTLDEAGGRRVLNTWVPYGDPIEPMGERESFTRAISSGFPAVSGLQSGPRTGDPGYLVRLPVFRDVSLLYVLSASVSPGAIRDILAEQKLPEQWSASVVDAHGSIVAQHPGHADAIGRRSALAVTAGGGMKDPGWHQGTDAEGRVVYFANARLGAAGWTVVVAVATAVVDYPFWRSLGTVVMGGVGFLLLSLLAATILGRRITRPLRALSDTADDLCSGRLTTHPSSPVTEIDALADALLKAGFQRAEAERTLRDREERLSAIIDRTIAGIGQLDLDGRFTLANDRLCEMAGRPREEVRVSRLDEFLHPEDAADGRRLLAEVIETGRSQTREARLLRPDGTTMWTSISLSFIRENGQPAFAILVALDITDRKRAEAERSELLEREKRARADAERANRAKDEFLATLSHELRTPLNALRLWAGVLRQRPVDPDTLARGIDTIDRNAALQAQLIDDLLDISRIASGKLRLEMGPIELQAVIESAVETVRATAEGKHLTLARTLDREVGPVLGDATRLQQVMWNLLSNALKFTPAGGRIEIRLQRRGADAEVTVTDTGQGIDPALLPHIFDRFRQGDSSSTRPQGGLGLGLAIARQLVELHHGTIRAESAGEGRGTIFTVTLPLTMAARPWSRGLAASALPVSMIEPLRDLAVLVVDDDADAREALAMSLSQSGARVTTAASVADAMAQAARQWPAALVSDIGMPGEDGISLIERVRRLEVTRGGHMHALALTAYAGEEDRRRILEAGYDLHVPKPVNTTTLIALLVRLVADGAPPAPWPAGGAV